MKKALLVACMLCGGLLFGCDNTENHIQEIEKDVYDEIITYTITFDYEISKEESKEYAMKFGKKISNNGLEYFKVIVVTDYGVTAFLFNNGIGEETLLLY